MMTLESFKAHAQSFIATVDGGFATKWTELVAFAEGKQTEADQEAAAVTLLQSKGYTVTKA